MEHLGSTTRRDRATYRGGAIMLRGLYAAHRVEEVASPIARRTAEVAGHVGRALGRWGAQNGRRLLVAFAQAELWEYERRPMPEAVAAAPEQVAAQLPVADSAPQPTQTAS